MLQPFHLKQDHHKWQKRGYRNLNRGLRIEDMTTGQNLRRGLTGVVFWFDASRGPPQYLNDVRHRFKRRLPKATMWLEDLETAQKEGDSELH